MRFGAAHLFFGDFLPFLPLAWQDGFTVTRWVSRLPFRATYRSSSPAPGTEVAGVGQVALARRRRGRGGSGRSSASGTSGTMVVRWPPPTEVDSACGSRRHLATEDEGEVGQLAGAGDRVGGADERLVEEWRRCAQPVPIACLAGAAAAASWIFVQMLPRWRWSIAKAGGRVAASEGRWRRRAGC